MYLSNSQFINDHNIVDLNIGKCMQELDSVDHFLLLKNVLINVAFTNILI